MIVNPDQKYWIQYKKGWSRLSKRESGSVSFGTKVAPSLNRVDPSFMNSVAGSILSSQMAKISYMITMLSSIVILSVVMLSIVAPYAVLHFVVRHQKRKRE
jgi:hypothetical protein